MLRHKILIIIALAFVACAKHEPEVWFCPMHKDYQTDHPGDCPICGMKLVKKEAAMQLPKPVLHEALTIPPDKQQMLGVLTAKPQIRKLALTLRLPAQVAYDPDLYTALVEYRQIRMQSASMPEGISGGALVSSAKLRLKQLGLGDDEIRQFANSETSLSRLLTGNAAGKALIALQVSEGEIGLIRIGQRVSVVAGAYGGKKFTGQVSGIGILVDAKRRVFTVRALVADSSQALRAQMFVSAEIALDAGKGLSLPQSAVFNTGTRQVVFVRASEAEFRPVEVKILGGNDEYAIVSGISEKDEIVVSSAFLFDSEARIKIGGYK